MKKKIIFRADGNSLIGLGHLFRLFSLVEMVKGKYDFIFLTREDSTKRDISSDYNIISILNKVKINTEPDWLAKHFSPEKHLIIVDGYQFNEVYQKKLKEKGFNLIYVDDLANGFMYADIVINHSPGIKRSDYRYKSPTKFALGTKYAMLRPKFLEAAKTAKQATKIDSAFVNFGGADKFNLTLKCTKTLLKLNQIKHIHVVLGNASENQKISALKKSNAQKITLHQSLSEKQLIKVMKECNFAVAPCSTILFELLCVKMPIYSGYFVKNQRKAFYTFSKLKIIGGEGNFKFMSQKALKKSIESYIQTVNQAEVLMLQHEMLDGDQKRRHLELIKLLL